MNTDVVTALLKRASYVATFSEFSQADSLSILGSLAQGQTGDLNPAQRDAWLQQIEILKRSLPVGREGIICFEFVIPRIGKRADNVLLIGDQVIVIEFKVGSDTYDQAAKNQVVDYALDLKNFHAGCHAANITPVLVATKAPLRLNDPAELYDGVYPPQLANSQSLAEIISLSAARARAPALSHRAWLEAGYRPTPTIVEASQALYRGHQVRDITHSEAGKDNLGATTLAISGIIDHARSSGRKAICLVSGVPGAGKTLAGLHLVCQRRQRDEEDQEHAVFLSGNGPLVKVLQEALARDEVAQAAARGERINKSEAQRKALAFIQNIHHFRDASLMDANPPVERVVVFDEAQRAWDRDQTSKFMQQKRGQPDFAQSEPEFLISVMDRHPTWAVIVCLIGGGQEINTGEAGLEEWLRALRDHFPAWLVYVPDRIDEIGYLPTFTLSELGARVTRETSLHLGVSLRSFRSEQLSAGIAALMTGQAASAAAVLAHVLPRFPIVLTRSLELAKAWVRARARGNERFGLLASSGGKRLKPLGITMDVQIDPCVWFLNTADDVRSSFYLEDAGSEFDVQGLELDWTIVAWDGDLIHQSSGWRFRAFKGTRWQEIRDVDAQRYRLNAYRVLLTRARQGMVIFVPAGDSADQTRSPEFYDPTWHYLRSIGLPELK
jgi:Uncharacterized conserved protein (DUF2075)